MMRSWIRSALLLSFIASLSGCGSDGPADSTGGSGGGGGATGGSGGTGGTGGTGGGTVTPPLEWSVDAAITPAPATIGDGADGTRPLGAVRDSGGVTSKFVENEIIVAPKDQAELDAIVARYGAKILRTNAIPAPPPELGIKLDPAKLAATEYTLEVDTQSIDLTKFATDALSAKVGGKVTVSSEAAARLLALVVHESAAGATVSPNFVLDSAAAPLLKSPEAPQSGGNWDGLTATPFDNVGSQSRVSAALEFLAARAPVRRTRVAVIDGGFWLDGAGHPLTASGNVSDLPQNPVQWDFAGNDAFAGGQNPNNCTGGSPCPWHGNDSASVATGTAGNSYGALGTGGLVADPILLRTSGAWGETAAAIRTAIAWNADVVSMSFGGECDNVFCDAYHEVVGVYPALRAAAEGNLVLVASAGNSALSTNAVPCRGDHVICVGALAPSTLNAISYSNYGPNVDIWAPTNIPAMPRPNDAQQLQSDGMNVTHTGTSASAPFVAGVAAILRAYSPSLSSDAVLAVLQKTATASTDAKVTGAMNAYEAVREVAGPTLDTDSFEPNNTPATASSLGSGSKNVDSATLSSGSDTDYYKASVGDFTNVTIDYEFTDYMGALSLAVTHQQSCGYVTQTAAKKVGAGARSATFRVTPDEWFFQFLSGGKLQAYRFTSNAAPAMLSLDKWEFPPNDTLTSAAVLPTGQSYDATIHKQGDVDYFKITNLGAGGGAEYVGYWFSVDAEDMPVTLRLFDLGGTELASSASSPDCNTLPFLTIPVGTYVVKVESQAHGAYHFSLGDVYLPPKPLVSVKHIFKKDMLGPDPTSGILLGSVDYHRTVTNVDHPTLELSGTSLHLAVFDLAGTKLLDGAPKLSATGDPIGESVSLTSLAQNQEFLVGVERVADEASIPNAALPYNLKLATQ